MRSPFLALLFAVPLFAQPPDPELLAAIRAIPAIDNHTHVPAVTAPDQPKDTDYDALPCSGYVAPSPDPFLTRPDNPKYLEAWQQLYGYPYQDATPAHVQELIAARDRIRAEQGDNFPAWVLDRLHIEAMLANRIAMGRGLPASRFPWVSYVDALMTPFDAASLADTPDRVFFYQREAMVLGRYLQDLHLAAAPATFSAYLAQVLTPTLERQRRAGAVAVKFEAAYLRTLDFGRPVPPDQAAALYARARTAPLAHADALLLQNALFRLIAREAGRLGLAVHIHTGAGCGSYFNLSTANPALLDSVLNDPALRATTFVLIHGGAGPYTHETAFLIGKPNVYADFSEQDWFLSPRALSVVLRDWLEAMPEKVLYGTDTFPGPPELDWDVTAYQTDATAREGLALALSGMLADGLITRSRALTLAHMVLHDNAARLYHPQK